MNTSIRLKYKNKLSNSYKNKEFENVIKYII